MKWQPNKYRSRIKVMTTKDGESIEQKMRRVTSNGEPIEDTAPIIYTERKYGVLPQYDHRTDKFEQARMAMDRVHASNKAKAQERMAAQERKSQEAPIATPQPGAEV